MSQTGKTTSMCKDKMENGKILSHPILSYLGNGDAGRRTEGLLFLAQRVCRETTVSVFSISFY